MTSQASKKRTAGARGKTGRDKEIAQKNARSYARKSPQGSTGQDSKHDR